MRYFIGFFITIGLIILLIIMLVSGGGKPKVPTTSKTLDSYAVTSAQVRMTIDGPVNSDQQHQQVRVTVDRDNVTFEQIQGYGNNVVNLQHYANNQDAYAVLLLSLAHAGFTNGNITSKLQDERGYCPLGDRYIFEMVQDGKDLERLWATSCGSPKTYLGNLSLTISLLKAQVPNYSNLTENISL